MLSKLPDPITIRCEISCFSINSVALDTFSFIAIVKKGYDMYSLTLVALMHFSPKKLIKSDEVLMPYFL